MEKIKPAYKNNLKLDKRAFTLIELLVVLVILGLLFVLLISRLNAIPDASKTTGVQTDFRSFQVAIKQVALEQQGFPKNTVELVNAINKNLDEKLELIYNHNITSKGKDPWGTHYKIDYYLNDDSRGCVVVKSAGEDMKINTGDDHVMMITYDVDYDGGRIIIQSTFDGWNPENTDVSAEQIETLAPGLYRMYVGYQSLVYSWQELIDNGLIVVDGHTLKTNYNTDTDTNSSSSFLDGVLVVSPEITSFDTDAFRQCGNISELVIPNTVALIGEGAFEGCSGMKKAFYQGNIEEWCSIKFKKHDSTPLWNDTIVYLNGRQLSGIITIPDSVETLGAYTFFKAKEILEIHIPTQTIQFGTNAFWGCDNLKKVYYAGNIEQWLDIDFEYNGNPLLYQAALYANNMLVTKVIIPESDNKIKQYMFDGCSSLTEVHIHKNVQEIETDVFCSSKLQLIVYEGTISEWEAIPKGAWWNAYLYDYTIQCSDGNIVFINGIQQEQ